MLFQSNEHSLISEYMNLGEPGALLLPASYFWDMKRAADHAEPPRNLPARLDPPLFRRRVGIASLRGHKLSAVAAGYRHFVTDYFRQLADSMEDFLKTEFREEQSGA